jgi:hypothetical protein
MYTKEQLILAKMNGTLDKIYKELVNSLVAARYSIEDEVAIMRQEKIKPEEYQAWFDYTEECKAAAREIINSIE